jgi:hypothetical protein
LWAYPAEEVAELSYNMWKTSSSCQLITKTVLKGQSSYSISFGKLDTKYPKKGSDLSKPTQIFGVPHLPRLVETWCRKKTSSLLNPDSDYRKTDP